VHNVKLRPKPRGSSSQTIMALAVLSSPSGLLLPVSLISALDKRLVKSTAHLWYESLLSRFMPTHHRVALACARLTVGEHTNVVSFERVFEHLQTNVLVHTSLTRELCVTRLPTNDTNRQFNASYRISTIRPAPTAS